MLSARLNITETTISSSF